MKSSYLKLSNLYTPSMSSNFVLKKYEELKIIYNDTDSDEDAVFHDLYIPFGIMDGCKSNRAYKDLIEELKINDLVNSKALEMIADEILLNQKKKTSLLEYSPIIACNSDLPKQDIFPITDKELNIIFLWRTSKLPFHSIACKVGV